MKLPRRRRAVALVITLWLIVVMTVVAYTTLFEANIAVELTRATRDRFYARMMARSGLGRAMVDLLNDKRLDQAVAEAGEQPFDAKGDPWAATGDDYTDVEMIPGRFTVRVVDEESLFPVRRPSLFNLMGLMEMLGVKEQEERNKIAAAIMDYVDFDDIPRFDNAPAELNEDEAYADLIKEDLRLRRGETVPYRKKNDRLQWVDELLDIYGVSPDLYYGSAWNGEKDRRISFRRPRYYGNQDFERDYRPGLRELVGTYNTGQLNVNTARPEVLQAAFSNTPEGGGAGEDAAARIARYRPEPRGSGGRVDNGKAFRNIGEVAQEAGVNNQILSQAVQSIRFQTFSNVFRIRSEGYVRGSRHAIEVVVKREWDVLQRDDSRGLNVGPGRDAELRKNRARGNDDKDLFQEPALRALSWREE